MKRFDEKITNEVRRMISEGKHGIGIYKTIKKVYHKNDFVCIKIKT